MSTLAQTEQLDPGPTEHDRSSGTTHVEQLGEFTSQLAFGDVPTAVAEQVTLLILDYIGQVLAGHDGAGATMVRDLVLEERGPEEATLIGLPNRVPARAAALANAVAAEALEFGDTHRVESGRGSGIHAGMCIIPAALAIAEAKRANGRSLIAAVTAGLETSVRVARVAPMSFVDRGYHITSMCSNFGAAAAVASLLGLDATRAAHAIAMCTSFAGGIMQFHHDGSWIKQLHVGWQATAGLLGASLAARGFTGPRECFEGEAGLFRTHLPDIECDFDSLSRELGTTWETQAVIPRAYPLCNVSGPFIDAALNLASRLDIEPDAIASIDCEMAPEAVNVICEPLDEKRRPPSAFSAKYSLPYAVGLALATGSVGVGDFTDEAFPNHRALELASKVCYRTKSDRFIESGLVEITLLDGSVVREDVPFKKGSLQNPMRLNDVERKFDTLTSPWRDRIELTALKAALKSLPDVDDVRLDLAPMFGCPSES